MDSYCNRCGAQIKEWEANYFAGYKLCCTCLNAMKSRTSSESKTEICGKCGLRITPQESSRKFGVSLCPKCLKEEQKHIEETTCQICGAPISDQKPHLYKGRPICLTCYRRGGGGGGIRVSCSRCKREVRTVFSQGRRASLCAHCFDQEDVREPSTDEAGPLAKLLRKIFKNL
ncbi:MAG: hypothetical protein ABIH99_00150 [Candidatus Micrarchaeota archaeon]